jgi:hypothetical protein
MSRFLKLSNAIWYCKYHIVGTPKYWYRSMRAETNMVVEYRLRLFASQCQL